MRNSKKILPLCITLMLLLCILTACGYTIDEKRQMKQYEKTGKKNAVSYIEEKYGFTPKVLEVFCDKIEIGLFWDASPDATGYVFAKMQEKQSDRIFWVYTTGEVEGTEECWDNYQCLEIEQAVSEKLEEISHIKAEHIDLLYGKFGENRRRINSSKEVKQEYGLLHDYFDGSNLSQVWENAEYSKIAVCTALEGTLQEQLRLEIGEPGERGIYTSILPEKNIWVEAFGNHVDYLLINYNDRIAYDIAHEKGCASVLSAYDINGSVRDDCFYVKEQYCVSADADSKETSAEYGRYEVKKKDDFYYVMEGGSYCDFEEVEKKMKDASNWNGRGFLDARRVYRAYQIDSDAECVHVFIPIKALKIEDVSKYMGKHGKRSEFRIVEQRYFDDKEKGWELDYDASVTDVIGSAQAPDAEKYVTATIYLHDFYKDIIFSVFVDEEN